MFLSPAGIVSVSTLRLLSSMHNTHHYGECCLGFGKQFGKQGFGKQRLWQSSLRCIAVASN